MAEAKSKKPAADKKIIDVKQGGDASSGTSRQIILNNRPIMKDPMMAEVTELANAQAGIKDTEEPEEKETETPGAPAVTTRKKVIPVAHDGAKEDEPTSEKAEAPKKETKPAKSVAKPVEDKPAPAKDVEPVTESEAPTEPEISPEPKADETVPKDEPAAAAESEPAADKPPAEEDSKSDTAEPVEPAGEAAQESKAGFAGDKSASSLQPGRSFDETEAPAAPVDDSAAETDKETKKGKKPKLQPGELTPGQQKAFESGEYFLPIIPTETRRTRLEVVLAIVFIVIVLAAWLDIMLDAGLLHVSGIQPLTHFFKS